jgi:hypothetical protein
MFSVLAVSRPKPSPSQNPGVPTSHLFKYPFPLIYHIQIALSVGDFCTRPLPSALRLPMVSAGKCSAPTHFFLLWPPTCLPAQLQHPKHAPHWRFLPQTVTKCSTPSNGVGRQMFCPPLFLLAPASHLHPASPQLFFPTPATSPIDPNRTCSVEDLCLLAPAFTSPHTPP